MPKYERDAGAQLVGDQLSNRLSIGVARLGDRMRSHASENVVYMRGAVQVSVPAVLGETRFEEVDDNGVVIRTRVQDFLIAADDLSISGSKTIPADGDTIVHVVGGVSYSYRVAAFGGEPPWRWSDEFKARFRIHTKLYSQIG